MPYIYASVHLPSLSLSLPRSSLSLSLTLLFVRAGVSIYITSLRADNILNNLLTTYTYVCVSLYIPREGLYIYILYKCTFVSFECRATHARALTRYLHNYTHTHTPTHTHTTYTFFAYNDVTLKYNYNVFYNCARRVERLSVRTYSARARTRVCTLYIMLYII